MKRIIQYLKNRRERRLRKYCLKCAIKFCQGKDWNINYVMGDIYYFLTGPHNDEKRP